MEQRRLYKSNTNRVLCGVCGGLGEYFNVDPTIIRLLIVLLVLGAGTGVLAYIIAAVIMPEKPVGY
ncbi:MAG: PspC domain-containing protein [Lachnospiraceae bacterium]|nr:PspC domain-containing protein [Lachnospiraceae bacterium]